MHRMLLLLLGGSLWISGSAHASEIDWTKVDGALGKAGTTQAGQVHRYGLPRSDLHVTVDGVAIKPAFALGGWLAFMPAHENAMAMGDLVLMESEINPVMSKLLEGGLQVTAVHNHLLRASPPTFYMHVEGHGDPVAMATAIRTALASSGTPFGAGTPPAPSAAGGLDTTKLDEAMGRKGQINSGVYQFSVPRQGSITEGGVPIPPAMGTANAINFQPTGSGKAAITGDFVVAGDEVDPLVRALRTNGIEVTAMHSHMIGEQPRLFFVHFWANDDAVKLARGVRAALDKTAVVKD